ncbi:hypothetical protein ACFLQN_04035 [Candidatus Aenigmatarchaeota archaeon]
MNKCPHCGKENRIAIKQAISGINCESQILFNIIKIACSSCRKQYFRSVSPVATARIQRSKNENKDEKW